ncbi:uncharacterized protein LOC135100152 [Scylla paramamosain]|uniref:uncharacterized protein LOC135100152 n=1 Tax=Scylla paramamosain TaxID=85552 RepID=UPI0030827397
MLVFTWQREVTSRLLLISVRKLLEAWRRDKSSEDQIRVIETEPPPGCCKWWSCLDEAIRVFRKASDPSRTRESPCLGAGHQLCRLKVTDGQHFERFTHHHYHHQHAQKGPLPHHHQILAKFLSRRMSLLLTYLVSGLV